MFVESSNYSGSLLVVIYGIIQAAATVDDQWFVWKNNLFIQSNFPIFYLFQLFNIKIIFSSFNLFFYFFFFFGPLMGHMGGQNSNPSYRREGTPTISHYCYMNMDIIAYKIFMPCFLLHYFSTITIISLLYRQSRFPVVAVARVI